MCRSILSQACITGKEIPKPKGGSPALGLASVKWPLFDGNPEGYIIKGFSIQDPGNLEGGRSFEPEENGDSFPVVLFPRDDHERPFVRRARKAGTRETGCSGCGAEGQAAGRFRGQGSLFRDPGMGEGQLEERRPPRCQARFPLRGRAHPGGP